MHVNAAVARRGCSDPFISDVWLLGPHNSWPRLKKKKKKKKRETSRGETLTSV